MNFNIIFSKYIYPNKEGMIIGGVIGYFIGKYFLVNLIDLPSINQTQGVLDFIMATKTSAIELAKTKLAIASSIIGASVGGYIDYQIPEQRFFR